MFSPFVGRAWGGARGCRSVGGAGRKVAADLGRGGGTRRSEVFAGRSEVEGSRRRGECGRREVFEVRRVGTVRRREVFEVRRVGMARRRLRWP